MNYTKSKIFILCGPSGAGKGTLINKLVKNYPDIVIPPSYTTRPERPVEGAKKYHFITNNEFKHAIEEDKILEYVKEHNYWYGTDKIAIENALNNDKTILMEIEPRGANYIKKQYPGCKIIFVAPKSLDELEKRIRDDSQRGKTISEEELQLRLQEAKKEMEFKDKADYVVMNGDGEIENALNELKNIFENY